jgi:hypothetical protein
MRCLRAAPAGSADSPPRVSATWSPAQNMGKYVAWPAAAVMPGKKTSASASSPP